MLSNIHKWRLTFFLSISVMLAVSCAPEKNCMICTEVRDDGRFAGFDTTYVSVRSLKDKWVLDSLERVGVTNLSDTLIICFFEGKRFFPPERATMFIKSDSTVIDVTLNSWYGPKVFYYDARADIWYRPDGTVCGTWPDYPELYITKVVFPWDITALERLLRECTVFRKATSCKIIRLVRSGKKIKRWDEYKFANLNFSNSDEFLEDDISDED